MASASASSSRKVRQPDVSNPMPYIILIGAVGSGKTTLSEKLTGKRNLGVKNFGSSATRVSTIYRTESFEFADTPGYMSIDNKLDHAVNIVCALHYRPVSRIFILVKFNSRIDNMFRDVKEIVAPLMSLFGILTILVTAWDTSDGTELIANEIRSKFLKLSRIQSIFFVGKETSGEELKAIFAATFTIPFTIQVPHNQIYKYFDIKKEDLAMITYISEKAHDYQKLVQDARATADGIGDHSEKENFLFSAQVALKETIDNFKEDFLLQFELDPLKPEEFASLDQFHVELTAALRGYRAYCKEFNTFAKGSDNCLSPFRRCPHCGEVYIKVHRVIIYFEISKINWQYFQFIFQEQLNFKAAMRGIVGTLESIAVKAISSILF